MSRGLSGTLLTAFNSDHIITVVAVKLEFDVIDGGTQYYHTGVGDLDYLGDTYTGVGDFGRIDAISEDEGIQMKGISLSFQGIDTTLIDLTYNSQIQGRAATLYLCSYDYDTGVITDGFELFSGYMDVVNMTRSTEGSMTLTVESIMSQFDLPNIKRFTSEDHKNRYPGDLFFDLMAQSAEKRVIWGAMDANNYSLGGGGRSGKFSSYDVN